MTDRYAAKRAEILRRFWRCKWCFRLNGDLWIETNPGHWANVGRID